MKNPDTQIKNFIDILSKHIIVLYSRFNLYLYLIDCAKDERSRILYKESPSFFKNVFDCLLADIIIEIHKLYDKSKSAKRSLRSYLKRIAENINNLSFNNNYLTLEDINKDLNKIDSISSILHKIGIHRNKYRAHMDCKYFGDENKLWTDAPISNDELKKVFRITINIIKKHKLIICGGDLKMIKANWDDIKIINKIINNYDVTLENSHVQNLIIDGKIPRKYDELK